MQRNPRYEAGFTRAVDHEEPEDLVMEEERRARRRVLLLCAAIVVAIAVAFGAFGLSTGQDAASKPLAQGRQLIAGNAHEAAIVELKRSLLADPDQPPVRVLLGREYAALGDWKAAEIEYGKALERGYEPERTLPLLVASVAQQGRYEKVVALVNGAALDSPDANADLKAWLGTAYFALGRDDEARAAWKAATDFVPGHAGALLAEAKALVARGAIDEAGALLARLPANAPRQSEVQALRGDIARAGGRPADAAAAYEAALQLDAGNLPLRIDLASTEVELGRFDEAQAQVAKIFVASPNHPKAFFIAAQAALGRNDIRAADEAITQAIQAAPRDGRAHLLAGTIAIAMARPGDAELHLREAMALMPKDGAARRALAAFYVQQHEPARADEAIGPLVASTPGDKRVAEIVADIALLQGDAMRAARAYDQVDAIRPDNLDAGLRAAALKFAAGDPAGGLARLRAAATANPEDIEADAALVAALLPRQPKEAVAAWNAMVRKRPESARTFEVRATIDLAQGDRDAARRSLDQAIALDPNASAAVVRLAQLDVDDRRSDPAKDRLRSFIATHPGQIDATMRLVAIERADGAPDETILALLRAARKADPRSSRAVQALAAYELDHGDAQRALHTADEGLAFAPGDASLLATAGDAALATGNATRAVTIFKALTSMNVGSVDYPTRLGTAWLAAGDVEAALAGFRLALLRQPDDVDLQRTLVARLLTADKAEEASRLLFEITRLAPRSPAVASLDADVKLARRQYPEAIAAYRRALETTPTPELTIRTFEALMKARQPGEANALLAGWFRDHPTDEVVRRFDADAALRANDHGRASDDFRALLRLRPNDPDLQRKLAASDAREAPSRTGAADPSGALRNATMQARPGP